VTPHVCTCVDTVIKIRYHVSPSNNMYNDNQVHYFKSNKSQHELGFMLSLITLKVMQMNLAFITHIITDKTIKKTPTIMWWSDR